MTTSADSSLWLDTAPTTAYPVLSEHIEVDVAVLGAGIVGLTTALLLKGDGAPVAVLEARQVGSGVTGCTTAKVTALQQAYYQSLRSRHGSDATAVYAQASKVGVEMVDQIARAEGIECDLERRAAFTYALERDERSDIESEYEAAQEAGLDVELVDDVDLPYATYGAVRLDKQIQFQPVLYTQGLAAAVDGDGSFVFEQKRGMSVSAGGSPCSVQTNREAVVRAHQVVVATHYPLLDRALFFARLEPERSYCVAARLEDTPPDGMSISAGPPTRSLNTFDGLLIVGGEGHSAGSPQATRERYDRLEAFALRHWPVREITHRWSAQDPISYDHLPVVGPYTPRTSRVFVASAFHKWGLTGGTAAALGLRDLLSGRDPPWAAAFNPNRFTARGLPKVAQLGAKFGADFVA